MKEELKKTSKRTNLERKRKSIKRGLKHRFYHERKRLRENTRERLTSDYKNLKFHKKVTKRHKY